jgi:hypothetical protein
MAEAIRSIADGEVNKVENQIDVVPVMQPGAVPESAVDPRDSRMSAEQKRLAFGLRLRQTASSRSPTQSIRILTQPTFSHMSGRIWTPPDCNGFGKGWFQGHNC